MDCGRKAQQWSYKHNGSDERLEEVSWGERVWVVGYSADPDDYDPRCRVCHWRYDASQK